MNSTSSILVKHGTGSSTSPILRNTSRKVQNGLSLMSRYLRWACGVAVMVRPFLWMLMLRVANAGVIEPLLASTNVPLLEDIISTQRTILSNVFNGTDVATIPQMWCLCTLTIPFLSSPALMASALDKEVQGYYESGMTVPDDITLLWVDDNWGNVRRFPLESERNRTGGAGVYYHVDYVGSPRDYKWITVGKYIFHPADCTDGRIGLVLTNRQNIRPNVHRLRSRSRTNLDPKRR